MKKGKFCNSKIKNAKIDGSNLIFNLGYQTTIAALLGFILILSYIILLIASASLCTPYGNWWFWSIIAFAIFVSHSWLYLIRYQGDQIIVTLGKPDNADSSARYSVKYNNEVVQQSTFSEVQIVVRPYRTFTGVNFNIPTIHYHVTLKLNEPYIYLNGRKEESLPLIGTVEKHRAVEEAKKIFEFLGMKTNSGAIESHLNYVRGREIVIL